jgi:hypothetical protein
MLPRDRVLKTMEFQPTDIIPLQIYPAPSGLYEHGQKLADLIKACGHDFGDLSGLGLPAPPEPGDFDSDGRYHAFQTDEWGTKWEYRIYGIWGHPVEWPLNDLNNLDDYKAPATPPISGAEFENAKRYAEAHKQKYFLMGGGGAIFETLRWIRRFEYILMDIEDDTPEINRIADIIMEYDAGHIRRSLAVGVDAIAFGDDLGTQNALMISPEVFRRFFKPRYKALFEPIVKAGKHIIFHSCGQISAILEDLREIGVDSIWPQLPLYDHKQLSDRCRELGISVQLHPDRGDLMQRAKPQQIRDYVHRLIDTFDTINGGSWLYLEIDPGFPYENVETVFETAMELRGK